MFDIGFSELLLVMLIGLVVLGPTRLPVVVRTVMAWIKTLRSLATTVQTELTQELKVMELQDKLNKLESIGAENLTPELKNSLETLRQATESLRQPFKHEPTPLPTMGKVQPEIFNDNGKPATSEKVQ